MSNLARSRAFRCVEELTLQAPHELLDRPPIRGDRAVLVVEGTGELRDATALEAVRPPGHASGAVRGAGGHAVLLGLWSAEHAHRRAWREAQRHEEARFDDRPAAAAVAARNAVSRSLNWLRSVETCPKLWGGLPDMDPQEPERHQQQVPAR